MDFCIILKDYRKQMKYKPKTADKPAVSHTEKGLNPCPLFPEIREGEIGILRIKEMIDKTTYMIFICYKERLLLEPATFIVQAVWGKRNHGDLQ